MVVLRADPWSPEYGMGFDIGPEESPLPLVDPFVESEDWSVALVPALAEPCAVWFVDGVRRVELRLLADDGRRRVPGLFGSYAVGAVRSHHRARFSDHRVGRSVVLCGGVHPDRVELSVGTTPLRFEPATDPGADPDRPLWRLQQLMREAEGAQAARAAHVSGSNPRPRCRGGQALRAPLPRARAGVAHRSAESRRTDAGLRHGPRGATNPAIRLVRSRGRA